MSLLTSLLCCAVVLVASGSPEDDSRTLTLVQWMSESTHSVSDEQLELSTSSLDATNVELELVSSDVTPRVEGLVGLVSRSERSGGHLRQENGGGGGGRAGNRSFTLWNCSKLYDSSYGYNASSCRFVRENCQSKTHLVNYLAFMKCDLPPSATVSL